MSVLTAARTLGKTSGWSLSPLDLQKRLYVAQLIHLGRYGHPLFSEPVEAWKLGPVAPALYHKLKSFGRSRIADVLETEMFDPDTSEAEAIQEAWNLTRHLSGSELVDLTHRPGGAWKRSRDSGVSNKAITLEEMRRDWEDIFQASDEAVEWAKQMAAQIEASPVTYLDGARQRSFRASLFGETLQ